ncbi:MAG: PEP-CTERM sorting domain-containing protein, partial [Candidatus Hydrogenedentes bacterium]|nr:PEP-CTERM sorting domain-containing protein [Candidatus Hydrogenedentota bacterium]
PHISLDEVQIFQSSTANQSVTSFSGGVLDLASSNLVYRMDPGHEVLLDYSLNHGSGSGDMFMYIEDSLFSYGQQYVYLYSDFGLTIREDAGFEEWAVIRGQNQGVVPEPSSMVLLGVGLAGLIARRRMRKS